MPHSQAVLFNFSFNLLLTSTKSTPLYLYNVMPCVKDGYHNLLEQINGKRESIINEILVLTSKPFTVIFHIISHTNVQRSPHSQN